MQGGVSGGQLSYGNGNSQPSLLQRDDEPQSTFFQPTGEGHTKVHVYNTNRKPFNSFLETSNICQQNGMESQTRAALACHERQSTWTLLISELLLASCSQQQPAPDVCMPRADDGAPKANVLAYSKGYVELQGAVLRVIPHVQNLETCARHCDTESACTHWRRCAGALPSHPPPSDSSCCIAGDLSVKTLAAQRAARLVLTLATPCCKARGFEGTELEDQRHVFCHFSIGNLMVTIKREHADAQAASAEPGCRSASS